MKFTMKLWTLVALSALAVASVGKVQAQQPGAAMYVGGTVWTGSENLAGFGKLGFGFNPNGQAFMADAKSVDSNPNTFIRGTWTQQGNMVTITFSNCVYRGHINGNVLSGTGQFNNGHSWDFSLVLFKNR